MYKPITVPIAVETTPTASIVMILSTVLTSSRFGVLPDESRSIDEIISENKEKSN